MAASIKKLIVGGAQTAGQAVGYLLDSQPVGDYYTEDGTAFARWLATDRVRTFFALRQAGAGAPDRWTLETLLAGRNPVTNELIRKYGPNGTLIGGIDVTVSPAPKSVSILWALADRELRDELELMVGQAVNRAIGRMLDRIALVRERYGPGDNDVRHVAAEDYLGVQVFHTTARLSTNGEGVPDPQLHVHNVLMGALDYAGRLRAIDSRAILQHRMQLDAEAQGHLAEMLRQRGFEIDRQYIRGPNGSVKRIGWEIKGVPEGLIKAMSSRRREIEDLRETYRELSGRQAEGPGWDKFVAEHRGPKSRLSPAEMRAAWAAEARTHEYGPEAVVAAKAAADARRAQGVPDRDERSPEADQLRREILTDLCREHAFVPERQLAKVAMQRAVGLLPVAEAFGIVGDLLGDGDLVQFADGQVTTLEVLAAEQRALAAADTMLSAPAVTPADARRVDDEIRKREDEGRPFDAEQARAVRLATSGARLVSITGPAGTGKGHASRAIASAWQAEGRRVIALAVAGRTAQQAQADSGAGEAWTLDGLEARIEHGRVTLSARDVLLVDEAGMVDHTRYVAVLEAAAAAGATVVQIGDDHQLSPVGPGGLWTIIHGKAEARGQAVELRTIWRARDPREAQAWTDLRAGRIEEALLHYRQVGRLRLYDTRKDLLAGMVADWWSDQASGLMVVDTSNAERDVLNRLAQERRLDAGELGPVALRVSTGREIRAGDRILFSKIHELEPARGQARIDRVENGTAATVLAVDVEARTATVRLHEPDRQRDLTAGADLPVELAYARHIAKGQGATVEAAGDVGPSMRTQRNALYTMASRSRAGSRIHLLRAEIEDLGVDMGRIEPAREPSRRLDHLLPAERMVMERAREREALAEEQTQPADVPAPAREAAQVTPTPATGTEPTPVVQPTEPSPAGLPEGAIDGADFFAEMKAASAAQERELVTIRAFAKQAQPLSTKQAIGERSRAAPEPLQAGWRDERARVGERDPGKDVGYRTDLEHARIENSFLREQRAAKADAALRQPARTEPGRDAAPERHAARQDPARSVHPVPAEAHHAESVPARHAIESVGRMNAERGNTVMALAYYRAAGRLETCPDPAARAAELWLADPRPDIVVVDQVQEQRVRDAIGQQRAHQPDAGTSAPPAPEPRIVLAHDGHGERAAQREAWKADRPVEHHHLVEAGAVERAYVVAPDHHDYIGVTRALSVAAQSHWITNEPSELTAEVVTANVERITTAQAAQARAQQVRQAERAAEMAEHSRERTAGHEAQRVAERGPQLENAGSQHQQIDPGADRGIQR